MPEGSCDYHCGITAIDAHYVRPGLAAVHLLEQGGRAALIDTGTSHSAAHVLDILRHKGIPPENVDYVIVTHVHLDHAGGAGALMEHLPNARLVVHPRGARHMVDPSRLMAGAAAVYGEEGMDRLFGRIVPVPTERVIEAPDGFTLTLNGRPLLFLDTPGHARHHFCVYDEKSRGVFTGDTFGISYREFDVGGREFIFPTTTPVQFEPDAAHASIDRLLALKPSHMYLTHYGRVGQPERLAAELHRMLDDLVGMAEGVREAGADRHRLLTDRLGDYLLAQVAAHGCRLPREQAQALLAGDVELNAQGLEVWLDRPGG
jgi:glyoxylase-like metal-dependent hydrolase (beta-lactamase superfamily II)